MGNADSSFDMEYFVYRKVGPLWVKITGGPYLDIAVVVARENSRKNHSHLQVRDKEGNMLYEFNNGVEY